MLVHVLYLEDTSAIVKGVRKELISSSCYVKESPLRVEKFSIFVAKEK